MMWIYVRVPGLDQLKHPDFLVAQSAKQFVISTHHFDDLEIHLSRGTLKQPDFLVTRDNTYEGSSRNTSN